MILKTLLQVAHVIVISDNRENSKRLAKGDYITSMHGAPLLNNLPIVALPSKPLNTIALSDADAASSLSFVRQKLADSGIELRNVNTGQ